MTGACTRVLDMIFVTASSDLTGEPLTSSDLTGEPLTRTPVTWAFIREGNRAPVSNERERERERELGTGILFEEPNPEREPPRDQARKRHELHGCVCVI